jgi:hypothetical protein
MALPPGLEMTKGMATAMVRSKASVTGAAASGTSSSNLGAKGGRSVSESRRSARRAAIYRQINSVLKNNHGVSSGDQSVLGSGAQVCQVGNRVNVNQYKKVGYEDAKTWMERRVANMKSGVPNWAAADLASLWCNGLKHQDLDETIAEIESINLANQYNQ